MIPLNRGSLDLRTRLTAGGPGNDPDIRHPAAGSSGPLGGIGIGLYPTVQSLIVWWLILDSWMGAAHAPGALVRAVHVPGALVSAVHTLHMLQHF